ncbi:hypothetical protein HUU42_13545 [bacterium]|nr:hypothetical protein [bacterium]
MADSPLIETWHIHNRINLYLLAAVPDDAIEDVSASKGRTVAEQFAHLHNVRLMWLNASAPELLKGLNKIEKENDKISDIVITDPEKFWSASKYLVVMTK